jgi:hypothetical protein
MVVIPDVWGYLTVLRECEDRRTMPVRDEEMKTETE